MQTLKRSLFSPNVDFLRMLGDGKREKEIMEVMKNATMNKFGVVLFADHPSARPRTT